ncbi:hypothetical protein EUGRSUZ_H03695 [Eucalyptus grandis]|uniref:Uncharacterized protein n=2 Tax=Eucalyptus grandis TaxID=71139 RepID=A0ACC3JUZ2_EUCGR|nr:hypothetical protein EUGRSUZ_H03695 [Eucalyptus grandis]
MSWMGWNRTSESFHLALVYGTAEDPGHAGVEDPTRASVSSTASSGSGSGSSLGSMSARHFLLTVVSLSLFCLISPPGENAKSRGLSIEKKIEFLESLTGGVSKVTQRIHPPLHLGSQAGQTSHLCGQKTWQLMCYNDL